MFAGQPQPVEIHHRGIWYSGELLGWRHENDGRCVARVRCVVDGLRHSTWKDLADLRLPEATDASGTGARSPDRRVGAARRSPWDDDTRPHVLLADLRTRPRPPAHAVTPPASRPATDRTGHPTRTRFSTV